MNALRVAVALVASAGSAHAGDIATERTQAATMAVITAIRNTNEAIEGFSKDIRALEDLASLKVRRIGDLPAVQDVFEVFSQIEQAYEEGVALAHTVDDVEAFFEERYDTYEEYLRAIENVGRIDDAQIRDRLERWNRTHLATIRGTLKAHGIHAEQIDSAKDRLALLQEKSRTAEGRMQVLQIGQEIATEEVRQLHELKSIVMEQSNLHATYFAFKQSQQADESAQAEWILRDLGTTIVGNESGARRFR